jgi:hypothetical protein
MASLQLQKHRNHMKPQKARFSFLALRPFIFSFADGREPAIQLSVLRAHADFSNEQEKQTLDGY